MSVKTAIDQFLQMDKPIKPGHSPRPHTLPKLKLELKWKLYAHDINYPSWARALTHPNPFTSI